MTDAPITTETTATPAPRRSEFRRFFFRGLAILLPTLLTIYILVAVYGFVDQRIAAPINTGIRAVWVTVSPWPVASTDDYLNAESKMSPSEAARWERAGGKEILAEMAAGKMTPEQTTRWNEIGGLESMIHGPARAQAMDRVWNKISLGGWPLLNVFGLIVAAILIYIVGRLVGGYLGAHMLQRGEQMMARVPIVKAVYPSVKQVTDFIVGGGGPEKKMKFNRVIAVQYPRMGCWSVGLVTGEALRSIEEHAGGRCVTVFVPYTPPFTGFVITVPVADTFELPMTIDEALRYLVTAGVIVPEAQIPIRNTPPAPFPATANVTHLPQTGPEMPLQT